MSYGQILAIVQETINRHTINKLNYDDVLLEYGIDSVSMIEIIIELEERFNIEFDPSALNYKLFKSIASISKYIFRIISGERYE